MEAIETCSNTKGLCALSSSKDICVLASPDKQEGSVRLIHFDKGGKNVAIKAH
jgi:hypothetical protein